MTEFLKIFQKLMEINNKLGAWLLMSALISSENNQTTIVKTREAGDYLNHAVFTDDELNVGLKYLEEKHLLVRNNQLILLNKQAVDLYEKAGQKTKNVFKILNNLEKLL